MKKKWISLLLVAVFLSSCSDEVPERRRKDYGEASAPIAGNVSVTASIVNKVDSAEFRKLMIDGLNEGAKALPNVQFKIESLNQNQDAQNKQVLNAAASTKAFVLNIADSKTSIPMLQELCSKKIPVVFFGSSPDERELANCPLDYDLRGDDMTAGVTQGLLVAQAYKDNPKMDKNADGKIQYAFVKATKGTEFTRDRSDWAVATMYSYPGLARPVEELFSTYADFDAKLATQTVEQWIADPRFALVEVILTNNDDIAIAVANTLQKHNLSIPVYGSDGGEKGLRAVKSGLLAGTARGDYKQWAHDAVRVAANLGTGRPPLEGLPVSYRMSERTIYPPFVGVDAKNVDKFLK